MTWALDPRTRDYVMDGGKPVTDLGLLTPAQIRLRAHRLRWMYAPSDTYGSDMYLQHTRVPLANIRRLADVAQAALKPIVDDGRAAFIDVTLSEAQRHAAEITVRIVDNQGKPELIPITPILGG